MKSLMLFLFLGATVALAEIHVENDPYRRDNNTEGLVKLEYFATFLLCGQLFEAIG